MTHLLPSFKVFLKVGEMLPDAVSVHFIAYIMVCPATILFVGCVQLQ